MPAFRSRLLTALGLVVICAAVVERARRVPSPLPANAPRESFSAGRAMEHVRAIAQRPHPGGTAEHARVREYVMHTIRALGLEPSVQATTGVGTHNSVAGRVLNVIARVPGQQAGAPAVLLAAHYDGVAAGPAAGDDAAGVAVVLETVRALRAGAPLAHDVILLFSDGEEAGLTGAAAFVREHPWARDVAIALNFDSGGTEGPSALFQAAAANTDVVRALQHVPDVVGSSLISTLFVVLPFDTDVSELALLGKPALSFGFMGGSRHSHMTSDDAAHLDAGSLQQQGAQALAMTRAFGNGPLPRPRMDDAVFFTVPLLGMVVYSARWAVPLAIIAAILVIAACVRFARRAPLWARDVGLGLAGIVVSTVLAIAVAAGVSVVMERTLTLLVAGWSPGRGVSVIGFALLTLGVATGIWSVVRRWASAAGAHLGALIAWVMLTMIVSWKLPGASFLFVLPLLGAASAAALMAETQATRAATVALWIASLVLVVLVAPVAYIFGVDLSSATAVAFVGMGAVGACVVGLIVSLSTWLLAPHFEALGARHTWRASLAAGLVFLAVSLIGAHWGRDYPMPSTLAYAVDAESSNAWLLTPAGLAQRGPWSAAALGSSARLVQPAGGAASKATPPVWLGRAIAGEAPTLAAPTRRLDVGVPDIAVISDSALGFGRRLTLRVRPSPGTYSIRLRAGAARIASATVDGRAIDLTRYKGRSSIWSLGYVLPPDDGFVLELSVRGREPLELDAIARSLGLPAAVSAQLPPRPPGVEPVHAGDQTVVHRQIRL